MQLQFFPASLKVKCANNAAVKMEKQVHVKIIRFELE